MKINNYLSNVIFLSLLLLSNAAFAEKGASNEKETQKQIAHGQLIWADLYSSDVNASLEFYQNVFGWTVKEFKPTTGSYHIFYKNSQPVAGLISRSTQRNKTEGALWIGSFSTDDIQEKVQSAASHNARIILAPHDFSLFDKRTVIADPQGSIFALLNLSEAQHKKEIQWDWAQLFSADPQKAANFYIDSFNFQGEKIEQSNNGLYLLKQNQLVASIVQLPKAFEQRDRWINFIFVDDIKDTLNKSIQLGAKIIYQAEDNTSAIIADPKGALLGLSSEGIH